MTNPMDLSGRTVLVTGASSGIGRETAVLLSQLGAKVVLTARNRERLEQTLSSLEGAGHRIEAFDLLQLSETPAWLKRISAEGPLHGLVHAAGIVISKPLRFQEPDEVSQTLRTNLETAFALAKGFRQRGVCAPQSSMVFISSVAGLLGIPGKSAYAASKAGIAILAASLATELARESIRVNCVAPGWVATEMTQNDAKNFAAEQYEALRRRHLLGFGQPRDVANAIAFLLADTGKWITGTTLIADGGFTAQ